MKIFLKAPRSKAPFTVYRGLLTEHHDTLTYTSTDFWSTTLNPIITNTFVNPRTGCCTYEIRVNAGIPVLFLEPITQFTQELEILLPPGILYESSDEVVIKEIYKEGDAASQSIAVIQMTASRFDDSLATYDHLIRVWASERREAAVRTAKKSAPIRLTPTRSVTRSVKRRKTKAFRRAPSYSAATATATAATARTRKLKKWSRRSKRPSVSNE